MTTDGIKDVFVLEGPVNGAEYFVRTTLLPIFMPYNGHTVVVMDNTSVHH